MIFVILTQKIPSLAARGEAAAYLCSAPSAAAARGPAGDLLPRPELPSRFSLAGPTDLSMKGGASSTAPSNSTSRGMQAAQLSPTEISAVRQLIAGYRESAAFLLRSADELENLILQQN